MMPRKTVLIVAIVMKERYRGIRIDSTSRSLKNGLGSKEKSYRLFMGRLLIYKFYTFYN